MCNDASFRCERDGLTRPPLNFMGPTAGAAECCYKTSQQDDPNGSIFLLSHLNVEDAESKFLMLHLTRTAFEVLESAILDTASKEMG